MLHSDLYQYFALDHSNRSKIGPKPWKIEKKNLPVLTHFRASKLAILGGWVGRLFWPYGVAGGKIALNIGDTPMDRYYHVVIVAELNIALLPSVVLFIECMLTEENLKTNRPAIL